MKTSIRASVPSLLLLPLLPLLPLLLLAFGCGATRTPDVYKSDVTKLLAAQNDKIAACYATALKDNPSVAGNVTLRFRLDFSGDFRLDLGRVRDMGIVHHLTTVPLPLAECTLKAVKDIKVSPPDTYAEVLWTWKFAPGEAPSAAPVAASPASPPAKAP